MDFAVPADHRVKIIESENSDEYLDLAREIKKKLWKMKMTVILIVIRKLGTMPKELIKGLKDLKTKGQGETIQTIVLLM